MKLLAIGTAALLILAPVVHAQVTSSSPAPDKYAWLEDVSGEHQTQAADAERNCPEDAITLSP